MSPVLLLAIGAIIVGPLAAYITASRKLSGKIVTSDASKLWDESKAIREDYRAQLDTANKRILIIETRVSEVERDNNTLARENLELRAKCREYETTIEILQRRLDDQAATIIELRELITALQQSLGRDRP